MCVYEKSAAVPIQLDVRLHQYAGDKGFQASAAGIRVSVIFWFQQSATTAVH